MPLPYIPPEILELIFENVRFNKDLKKLNRVSRDWYLAARKKIWNQFNWYYESADWHLYEMPQSIRDLYKEVSISGDGYYMDLTEGDTASPFILVQEVLYLNRRLPNIKRLSIDASALYIDKNLPWDHCFLGLVTAYEEYDEEVEQGRK